MRRSAASTRSTPLPYPASTVPHEASTPPAVPGEHPTHRVAQVDRPMPRTAAGAAARPAPRALTPVLYVVNSVGAEVSCPWRCSGG
ncbi:MAG: hypothetical protein ABW321_12470, partial [Polyangiales bacterium]